MTFENLESWRLARETVREVYHLIRLEPLCRDLELCNQLKRAAISLLKNIARDFARQNSAAEAQSYYSVSGSTGELLSLLYVIEDNFPENVVAATALHDRVAALERLTGNTPRERYRVTDIEPRRALLSSIFQVHSG